MVGFRETTTTVRPIKMFWSEHKYLSGIPLVSFISISVGGWYFLYHCKLPSIANIQANRGRLPELYCSATQLLSEKGHWIWVLFSFCLVWTIPLKQWSSEVRKGKMKRLWGVHSQGSPESSKNSSSTQEDVQLQRGIERSTPFFSDFPYPLQLTSNFVFQ